MYDPHPSPLRYPGGKTSLTEFLSRTIRLNGLQGGAYVEPFAGGAGAALGLLFSEKVSEIYINDKDPRIHAFWKSILHHTEEFLERLEETPITVHMWKKQKEVVRSPDQHPVVEVGFATFYLNRCNRSGVLNGGPIGGMKQDGEYKISARFNKDRLRKRIEKIALYSERIKVYNNDAVTFLMRIFAKNRVGKDTSLVYMDPPYFEKARRLYAFYFHEADHERLATYLNNKADFRWIISYDDSPSVRELYSGCSKLVLTNYSVHSARIGRELLISSPSCSLPTRPFPDRTSGRSKAAQACS
jgi:DNA adenine methylase